MYYLKHLSEEKERGELSYDKIHFFSDTTQEGNDYGIYDDEKKIGHTVANMADTMKQLRELFDL